MNQEFKEILKGVKRSVAFLNSKEKKNLGIATGIMLITGVLTNFPAVILGRLVDNVSHLKYDSI